MLISLPLTTLSLNVASFVITHPALIQEIAGHALAHTLYSYISRAGRRRGMSRREMRKTMNRKRRWFVDNIIMHHKRLHDQKRASIISNARERALAKKEAAKKSALSSQRSLSPQQGQDNLNRWRNNVSLRERGAEIRGRVDARRLRARSRWLSIAETKS